MEADSEIFSNKTIDNKSYLSLNYVYKKIIMKENLKSSKNELRALNYEKIAKFYMKSMKLKDLLSSIFKLKITLNKNNPFLKYIKDAQPYNFSNIRINISTNKPNLEENFKNKIIRNSPKKEKLLNFHSSKKIKNFYYYRMRNIDDKKSILNKNKKIIMIQKHVRGFLSKKIIDEEVNKIIAKRIINKILIIQRVIKNFIYKKKSLDKLIVNIIQNERVLKGNKITDLFSFYHYRNFYKKNLIIKKILKSRNDSVLFIQNKFRDLMFIKQVKEIIKKEKKSYVLTYPFKAESVQIKIFKNISYKLYNFIICPIRKYFVLYIDKSTINPGEYLCQMIVDNYIKLDNRYKYMLDNKNNFYNLIYIGQPVSLGKTRSPLKEDLQKNINKKEKSKKKSINKLKNKNIIENDDDIYYYCYNDNTNSSNSYSNKSNHEKNSNKLLTTTAKQTNNLNGTINEIKINKFLEKNKKEDKSEKTSVYSSPIKVNNFINLNAGKFSNKKICVRHYDFEKYFKEMISKKGKVREENTYNISFESPISKKDGSIQSQQIIYENILDELSPSVSSSNSHISINNIDSYSKRTHRAKFCSNFKEKMPIKKAKLNSPSNSYSNSNDVTVNTTINRNKKIK